MNEIQQKQLVALLERVEKHLLDLYGNTLGDYECDPKEEEGWILYCETKKEKEKLIKS
jgi:hypothetical protein